MVAGIAESSDIARRRAALGPFGFQWLCACALSPVLRFSTTVHLGATLAQIAGRPPPDAEEHRALFQLDWFRQGRIPEATRVELLKRVDPRLAAQLREALFDLYAQAEPAPAAELPTETMVALTRARTAAPRRFQAGDAILMRFVTGAPFPWLRPVLLTRIRRWLHLRVPRLRWIFLGLAGSAAVVGAALVLLPDVLKIQRAVDQMASREVTRRQAMRVPERPKAPVVVPKPAPASPDRKRRPIRPVKIEPSPPIVVVEPVGPVAEEGEAWRSVYTNAENGRRYNPALRAMGFSGAHFSQDGSRLLGGDSSSLVSIDLISGRISEDRVEEEKGLVDFQSSYSANSGWIFGFRDQLCGIINVITRSINMLSDCEDLKTDLRGLGSENFIFPGIDERGRYIYSYRNGSIYRYSSSRVVAIGAPEVPIDGKDWRFSVGDIDDEIILGDKKRTFLLHMGDKLSVVAEFGPHARFSGGYIVEGGEGKIFLRDARTGQEVQQFPIDRQDRIAIGGDRLASLQADGTLTVWSILTGKPVANIKTVTSNKTDRVDLEFSPDGTRLAAIVESNLTVWQLQPTKAPETPAQATPSAQQALPPPQAAAPEAR